MNELVLIADDDPFSRRILQELCASGGYRVVTAHDGESALDVASRKRPDVMLLDLRMPNLDGLTALRVLRSDPDFDPIPILVVADHDDHSGADDAAAAGAHDTIRRPFRSVDVHQRVRNALRLRNAELRASIPPELGVVDPLTRAGTRSQMLVTLEYEFSRAVRYAHALSCVAVHIHGVDPGSVLVHDAAVVTAAHGLRECVRGLDHVFRSGASSFMVLLPETDVEGTATVLSRIRGLTPVGTFAEGGGPRLAAGAATYPSRPFDSATALLTAAEAAASHDSARTV
ncbi:MAG: response regulator [Myxococcales bacterium]|nr:response regulator [Myxococcales bacterium]